MKKRIVLLVILIPIALVLWFIVKQASVPVVQVSTGDPLTPEPAPATKDDMIVVESPLPRATVSSPILIKGKARGNWYFEGSFPITLTNWDGLIIAEGYATAQGEWMTTQYVPFTASLSYTLPPETPYRRGFLILHKDNPSGEPQFDNAIEIEVTL